jgi:hypothetical protein
MFKKWEFWVTTFIASGLALIIAGAPADIKEMTFAGVLLSVVGGLGLLVCAALEYRLSLARIRAAKKWALTARPQWPVQHRLSQQKHPATSEDILHKHRRKEYLGVYWETFGQYTNYSPVRLIVFGPFCLKCLAQLGGLFTGSGKKQTEALKRVWGDVLVLWCPNCEATYNLGTAEDTEAVEIEEATSVVRERFRAEIRQEQSELNPPVQKP